MTPIEFHPDAAQEASDAVDYYDSVRAGLGDDGLLGDDFLQQNPQLVAPARAAIRACSLDRFPYSVYYEEWADLGSRDRSPQPPPRVLGASQTELTGMRCRAEPGAAPDRGA